MLPPSGVKTAEDDDHRESSLNGICLYLKGEKMLRFTARRYLSAYDLARA